MRLAFSTVDDPDSPLAYSGSALSMRRSLEAQVESLPPIGPLHSAWRWPLKARAYVFRKFLHRPYLSFRSPALLKSYGRQVAAALAHLPVDGVISPGTSCLAHLETDKPMAFWTDASFASFINYWPGYHHLHPWSIAEGHAMERAAYARTAACIFSSEWAAREAAAAYEIPAKKLHVVPYGPNLTSTLTEPEMAQLIAARTLRPLRLLFVGVDWVRKGGDHAVAVCQELHRAGVPFVLQIVGCRGPVPPEIAAHVQFLGFISKATPEGRAQLQSLFENAHCLLLPTRVDCCAVAFAEASAFGLPAVGFNSGGNGTAIRDEVNGRLFPVDSAPALMASWLTELLANPARYRELAHGAYAEYRTRLNWPTAATRVLEILRPAFGLSA